MQVSGIARYVAHPVSAGKGEGRATQPAALCGSCRQAGPRFGDHQDRGDGWFDWRKTPTMAPVTILEHQDSIRLNIPATSSCWSCSRHSMNMPVILQTGAGRLALMQPPMPVSGLKPKCL